MTEAIKVYKGRTNTLRISLSHDVSEDIITSDIRKGRSHTSDLIAMWMVNFLTDGTDGELILTIDDSIASTITENQGYMDLKRVSNGEPLNVLEDPLLVVFKDVITP